MATEADHVALANKNHRTLLYLMEKENCYPEWIATVAFYKAIQVIEAVFCHELKKNAHTHRRRLDMLKQPQFKDIFPHFRVLWSASTIARYLHDHASSQEYSTFTDYCPADKVIKKFVKKRLRPIEEHSISMLSEEATGSLLRIPSE